MIHLRAGSLNIGGLDEEESASINADTLWVYVTFKTSDCTYVRTYADVSSAEVCAGLLERELSKQINQEQFCLVACASVSHANCFSLQSIALAELEQHIDPRDAIHILGAMYSTARQAIVSALYKRLNPVAPTTERKA
jgi:hypothetical protein